MSVTFHGGRGAVRGMAVLGLALLLGGGLAAPVPGAESTSLLQALAVRDFDRARTMVQAGAPVNVAHADGKTPLMMAARHGASSLVGALLDAGAEVDATNRNGGTALMYGAISGDRQTMRLLLRAGADVSATGSNGWSAMTVAAAKGHAALVEMLLAAGADPDQPDVYGWTPLMRAAAGNRRESVAALLTGDRTDLSHRDDDGASALHRAAEAGHREMVLFLMEQGADPGALDAWGRTPAQCAASSGHEAVARLLARADSGGPRGRE